MNKKRFIQACEIGGSMYGQSKRTAGKKVSPVHNNIDKKDLATIYNKFYKNQVNALYSAIHGKKHDV